MSNRQTDLVLADTLLDSLLKLPKPIQAKVKKRIDLFRQNPDSPGTNLEKIEDSKNLYSVRIDKKYRGIMARQAGAFVLLYVDDHDPAYAWARHRRMEVNPETGVIQLFTVQSAAAAMPTEPVPATAGILTEIGNRHLCRLGIPEPLIPLARSITDTDQFEQVQSQFPPDAREAMYMLLAGYSFAEAMAELQQELRDMRINTDNLTAALNHPGSQAHFWVVEGEEELKRMLDAPQEKWRVFLHPSQRRLVERPWNGPVRILGGAGTGKTVAAMHRAKWLAAYHAPDTEVKILVLTFTRNLAEDLKHHLRQLITREEHFQRLVVINLDLWVYRFLRHHDFPQKTVIYHMADSRVQGAWTQALQAVDAALALPDRFYLDEWDKVILGLGVSSREDYLQIERRGRSARVSRSQRSRIWPVFAAYRERLRAQGLIHKEDAYRAVRNHIEARTAPWPYGAVVVDEVQDFGDEALRLIQVLAHGPSAQRRNPANRLFLAGDAHQRIYDRQAVLSQCGIQIRGRSRRLRLNYRTSEPILQAARSVLEGMEVDDLDGGTDTARGYRSLFGGPLPEMREYGSFAEALLNLSTWVEDVKRENDYRYEDFCFVTRTRRLRDQWGEALQRQGVETHFIEPRQTDRVRRDAVHLATAHRVKGLEFSAVVLLDVDPENYPLMKELEQAADKADWELCLKRERSLLHVAMSRAKRHLLICTCSTFSEFLQHLTKELGPSQA